MLAAHERQYASTSSFGTLGAAHHFVVGRQINQAASAFFSATLSAPDALISAISFAEKRNTSRNTSSVCSPSSGERRTSAGESDSLIGLPTVRYRPRAGCSTSTTVPVARKDDSSASSFIDKIGPTGMS